MSGRREHKARASISRAFLRVPFLRRLYVRRVLAFLEKSKRKRRPLPPELRDLDAMMRRLPARQRPEALEAALRLQVTEGDRATSREMRRAAARQGRQSGRGGSHRRPGAMRVRDYGKGGPPAGGAG